MGITIHYRGTMDDISQVEAMENRLLDLVFSLGGKARIWRSFADHDSSRVVRGLLVDLEPGQDTLSLLISPEGHLVPLFQIEDAETEPFDEPPYCFVKTQFGSLQGHIAIVHLLDALRQRFCSNLSIFDEGEYYESRDVAQLSKKMHFLRSAISAMAEGLSKHGLSDEAAEDPNILATRIARIAALVQEKLLAEPSAPFDESTKEQQEEWSEPSLDDEVATMDRLRRKSELRNERMARRIAEATAAGLSTDEAFDLAMQEEGFPTSSRDSGVSFDDATIESWNESLPANAFDKANERARDLEHPAIAQANAFVHEALNLSRDNTKQSSFFSILARASMEIAGALAQATSDDLDDNIGRALTITQLKRALSGHAYAQGAIFGLRSQDALTEVQSEALLKQLASLLTIIHELSEAAWT